MSARRLIYGIAATSAPMDATIYLDGEWSQYRHALVPAGCQHDEAPTLVLDHAGGAAPLMTDDELQNHAVGKVLAVEALPDAVRFMAEIDRTPAGDEAWQRIKAGELRGVSVGAVDMHLAGWDVEQGQRHGVVDRWRLRELSLCVAGANPEARIEMFVSCA